MKTIALALLVMLTLTACDPLAASGVHGLDGLSSEPETLTIDQMFDKVFGDRADDARKIADCESSMDPKAISDTNDWGLMQVNQIHTDVLRNKYGWSLADMLDPWKNLVFSKYLYDRAGGFQDWFMSRHCHHISS